MIFFKKNPLKNTLFFFQFFFDNAKYVDYSVKVALKYPGKIREFCYAFCLETREIPGNFF